VVGGWMSENISAFSRREKCFSLDIPFYRTNGTHNNGAVFEIVKSRSGYEFGLVHSFDGSDGAAPFGALNVAKGNLLGTTYSGGTSGAGTVFELSASDNWTVDVLYSFSGGSDGGNPISGVVSDSRGNVYGITTSGGYGYGVVYQLAP
jgi:uncharacterized repeat protein (TIGR03803 family)